MTAKISSTQENKIHSVWHPTEKWQISKETANMTLEWEKKKNKTRPRNHREVRITG